MSQLTVDESLVRRMARDAAIYSLTRPWAIVMWVALAAGLIVGILGVAGGGPGDADVFSAWMPVIVMGLAAYAILLTVSSARRAVRIAMPPGAVVRVSVDDDALRLFADRRTSQIRYDTFESIRAGRDAVLLKIRGASVATAVPRALLSDDDVEELRRRIG